MLTSFIYSPKKTFIHYLSSNVKIFSLLLFSLFTIISHDALLVITLSLIVAAASIHSNMKLSKVKNIIKATIPFIIFIFIINIIFNHSAIKAFTISFKILLILFYSLVIPATSTIKEINDGLLRLLSPLRRIINVNDFALRLTLSFNFLSYLPDQAKRIFKIQKSRGINFEAMNFKEKVSHLKDLLFPLFACGFRKADKLALAMEIRNFENIKPKSSFWSKKDICVIIFHVTILMLVIWKEVIL